MTALICDKVSPVFLELFQQLFLQGGGEVCPHLIAAAAPAAATARPLAVGVGGVGREDDGGLSLARTAAAPLAQQPAHEGVQLGGVRTPAVFQMKNVCFAHFATLICSNKERES